jgi:hypothetical protein
MRCGFRKLSINIILVIIFGVLEAAVILLFMSQIYLDRAGNLEKGFRWKRALTTYRRAVILNPFDTGAITELADFLMRQSVYQKDKTSYFEEAESLYAQALELNPRNAEYAVTLGRLQVVLFFMDKEEYKQKLDEGLKNLRGALKNDPNGIRVGYLAGYAAVSVWKYLNEDDKELFVDRLRYSFANRPLWRLSSDYRYIWRTTADFALLQGVTPRNLESHNRLYNFIQGSSLWRFRAKEEEVVNYYKRKENSREFEDEEKEKLTRIENMKQTHILTGDSSAEFISFESWSGESSNGAQFYEDGNMYWAGTIHGVLGMPEGESVIVIQARGLAANGVFPYMIVEVDGKNVGEKLVDSAEWRDYSFRVNTEGGLKVLSVTYVNDEVSGGKGEDRNLYVGEAKIR